MAKIGQYIANNSSLSPKNCGYARWSDLIRATEYFEETSGENHQLSFRSKKPGTPPKASLLGRFFRLVDSNPNVGGGRGR